VGRGDFVLKYNLPRYVHTLLHYSEGIIHLFGRVFFGDIKDYRIFTESNGIFFAFTNLFLCFPLSLGFVGGATTFSTRYHKFAISKRLQSWRLPPTSDSLILGVAIAATALNKLQSTITGSKIGFHTSQPFSGPHANHWYNSASITEAWTYFSLKPSNNSLL
jgi:hypothetical protein